MDEDISGAMRFAERVCSIVDMYQGKPTAVFFLGFSTSQTRIIMQRDDALQPSGVSLFDDNGYLDLVSLAPAAKETFGKLMSASGVSVGVYEQLASLHGALKELYSGNIVVVKNNLFETGTLYPCAACLSYLSDLKEFYDNPKTVPSKNTELAASYYADVSTVGDNYLVCPIQYSSELECEELNFFPVCQDAGMCSKLSSARKLDVPSPGFLEFAIRMCSFEYQPVILNVDEKYFENGKCVHTQALTLASILEDAHIECSIVARSQFDHLGSDSAVLLPILQRYWGKNAQFRTLKFYRNPDYSTDMIELSQGDIAAQVAKQSVLAMSGNDSFQNIFVTAPTGAGKSVLFQIPAIYLAMKYHLVTIIVEPLISLMRDQIRGLEEHGIGCATALNSDLTYAERLSEIQSIKDGKKSIVYLSPELLLGSDIKDIIGDRPLGLFVVDEAHTVALWGKDFRADYWFLGDYLSKLQRAGYRFPIFCLTATAVYGGADDVVHDVIESLELGTPKLYLGNVRRDDILFDIRVRNKKDFEGTFDAVKTDLAVDQIERYLKDGLHALVYCPFTTHVNNICYSYHMKAGTSNSSVLKYHGRLDKPIKSAAQNSFAKGNCRVMICTNAFGMGVDVDDITGIYHYAPTTLSDYVQEIGRGARRKDLTATASIDFFRNDSRYSALLYSISGLRQKQLKEIMKKLFSIYSANRPRRQNILISPKSFTYLFGEGEESVNKTKSALLMIAKDLRRIYGFPVIVVKSKPSYTKNYICIPEGIAREFDQKFGKYCKHKFNQEVRIKDFDKRKQPDIRITNDGEIYEVDTARMWEDNYSEKTFNQFKKSLFDGSIIKSADGCVPAPRFQLKIHYSIDFHSVEASFEKYIYAIQKVFVHQKKIGKMFTAKQFKSEYAGVLDEPVPFNEFPEQILAAFVKHASYDKACDSKSTIHCLQKNTGSDIEARYQVVDNYVSIADSLIRKLHRCIPDSNYDFKVFLSKERKTDEEIDLAVLLELFGLATYEMRGGDDAEIFIRLNDPEKLQNLSNDLHYSNRILQELNQRHKNSRSIITGFFLAELDDCSRWDVIEKYFLGDEDYVANALNLADNSLVIVQQNTKFEDSKTGLDATVQSSANTVRSLPYSDIWDIVKSDCATADEVDAITLLASRISSDDFEKPIYNAEVEIPSLTTTITAELAWPDAKVLLFTQEETAMYMVAIETNWNCYLIGGAIDFEGLLNHIAKHK